MAQTGNVSRVRRPLVEEVWAKAASADEGESVCIGLSIFGGLATFSGLADMSLAYCAMCSRFLRGEVLGFSALSLSVCYGFAGSSASHWVKTRGTENGNIA